MYQFSNELAATTMGSGKNLDFRAALSKRELEIVSLLRSGLTYQQIANKLSISPYTVKTHMQRIYKKTGASNKITLLLQLSKEG